MSTELARKNRRAFASFSSATLIALGLLLIAAPSTPAQPGGANADPRDEAAATGATEPGTAQRSAPPRADLADIEGEVMCPICGTLLELSEAPQAQRQRAFIRELIAEGRTKEEIKDALVAEYGKDVLAVPEASGIGLAAWVLPGAGLGLAAIAIGFAVRRWRGSQPPASEGQEGTPPPAALDASESERLEADMRRHDEQ